MIYGVVICCIIFLISIVSLIIKGDIEFLYLLVLIPCILLFNALFLDKTEYSYIPVKYENDKIIQVEESNYHLAYGTRKNYWDFKTKVTEYKLFCKGEEVVTNTKHINDIIEYFKPKTNEMIIFMKNENINFNEE